ncbi:hypothetical protein ATO7_04160 [Oceanococcus atlanticus]|uniref:Uncharacterized protein n=1 Tax=Oceanococcus atlanticus TaxID=1317117 RepID=A0A1Y1SIA6_9GAMM|nr:hypothetical protein ATO7_04160 [Oceanococcus atlanticus]
MLIAPVSITWHRHLPMPVLQMAPTVLKAETIARGFGGAGHIGRPISLVEAQLLNQDEGAMRYFGLA